jgi:two-component system, sporulation sensor kinase E
LLLVLEQFLWEEREAVMRRSSKIVSNPKPQPDYSFITDKGHKVIITSQDSITLNETVSTYKVETTRIKSSEEPQQAVVINIEEDWCQKDSQRQCMEKLSLAGEIAAGTLHEIKNPLTSIQGFVQLIENSFDENDSRRHYTRIITGEIERLNWLLTSFMVFAKPHPAKVDSNSINVLIEDVFPLIESKASMNSVAIVKELDNTLPDIMFDKEQLKQVIINISNNAIDAMEDSGGKLYIKTSDGNNGYLKIDIQDTGKGIEPSLIPNLFKPFNSTKKDGLGLGLSISKRIMESHSGYIKVDTKPGEGTRFQVFLPKNKVVT